MGTSRATPDVKARGAAGFMGGASGRVRKSPGGRSENLTAGVLQVITAENAGCGSQ